MPEGTITEDKKTGSAEPHGKCADQPAGSARIMQDGQPGGAAILAPATRTSVPADVEDVFDLIAGGLYRIASMLVGEGEPSIRVMEKAVANAEIPASHDPAETRRNSRYALCAAALDDLTARDATCLSAPEGLEHAATCISDDELDAAGMSRDELEQIIAGSNRDRVRDWLEGLPVVMRTIFVLRAVAGFSAAETSALLQAHGGVHAAGWNAEAVRELFRQGMCSLASQVLQAVNH